jgi:serine/threonine-protein kinase
MDTKVTDALNGALLDGRYRIRGRVARGGMATVYQAMDERLERNVAVKVIHPERAGDARFVQRFNDEAKTAARLSHPNVVAVFDQGTYNGTPYLIMEYVRGRTLREILSDRRRLYPAEALAVLEQMLAALAVAHRMGLVHRDVKPENVLIAPPPNGSGDLVDAVVKVADFGLARAAEVGGHDSDGTLTATASYVAPELVSEGVADPRADVYSAGIVLFEMLTGRVPYEGDRPAEVAWQHVDNDVPPPSRLVPGIPPVLDSMVARATARSAAGRPADAGAFLAEVQAVRDDIGTAAVPDRAITAPTVVVAQVDQRPSWARLPAARTAPAAPGYHHTNEFEPVAPRTNLWDSIIFFFNRLRATQRGRTQLASVIVVLCLLAVTGIWWFGFGQYTTAPSFLNLTKANAVAEAQQTGFSITWGPGIFSEQIPKDTVIRQDPGPGQKVVRGGPIQLDVSLGPERYVVPQVIGQSVDVAVTQTKEHFVVQQVDGYSDTLPVGFVVATDPAPGTPLPPNSVVKIIVCKGQYPLHVPNVVGNQLTDAQNTLQGMGFQVTVQRDATSTRPRDEVLSQDPAAGTGLGSAGKITLVVSDAPGLQMPDLSGQQCSGARTQLQQMGLQVNVDGQDFLFVRGEDPPAGTNVNPGQQVTLHCNF